MTPLETSPSSYAVTVLGPDPARLAELEVLFVGAGYAVSTTTTIAAGQALPGCRTDAVVLDTRGLASREPIDLGPLSALPLLVLSASPVGAGAEQQLILRVALQCRRGRVIRAALQELGLTMSSEQRRVSTREGDGAVLTPVEFELLQGIVLGAGEVVARERLLRRTWRGRRRVPHATLDSHIRGIRAKLNSAGVPLLIRTCRGLGYAWVLPA